MSETQEKYETDTDAQPTPGPWKIRHGVVFSPEHYPGDINQIASILASTPNHHDEANANAQLIAAAGTAAQEAREMGYDPVAAVEALPKLLESTEQLLQAISAEASTCAKVSPPVREKICSSARDALTSAEGGDQ